MKKILLVSSSSGGHVYPCFILGEELKKRGYQITYLGIKGQYEETILPSPILINIPNSFKKSLNLNQIKKLLNERKKIRQIIKENDSIIAFGGFITFITTIMNIGINKKLYLHEQNVILGDSIKFSYPFCQKLFLSFNNNLLSKKRSVYTSNPSITRILHREDVNITKPKVMFVFGSLSSKTCLIKVKEFISSTKLDNQFLVVAGKMTDEFKMIKKTNLIVKEKVDMSEELKNYDLVFSRAGATTLLELIKSGVEIVLIPSPYVKNHHQEKNAEFFKNQNIVDVISEKEFKQKTIEEKIINLKRKNSYLIKIDPISQIIEEVENE